MVTFLLVIVGALNWGLVGVFDFNLVSWLFYDILMMEVLVKLVYILVGLAAVYEIVTHKASCTHCGAGGGSAPEKSEPEM